MVPGIDSFREKFKDYTDYYTIIGGTACDIILSRSEERRVGKECRAMCC